MNVVHVNASDGRGGAGRACFRLHQALQQHGVRSRALVQRKYSVDPAVEMVDLSMADTELFRHADLIQRIFASQNRTDISNTHFSISLVGSDLSAHPAVEEAEIIHLHWVASMQTTANLRQLLALNKPVVWTVHDLAPFTGGCHFPAGCVQFRESCSACPQLRCDPFGLPAAVLRDKLEFLTAANLTVVAPSLWIAGQARESALFRSCPRIEVIPNGIDTQVFRPRPQREARAALGVPVEGNYLLCGANYGEEKRKGFELLTRVLSEAVRDPRFLRAGARVLWVGEPPAALACSDLPLTRLGRVAEEERMALAYAAADLFVLPSLEDNLPNMLLEALSSATPVVAFAVGGISEVVRDGVNGRLVPVGDEREMAEALLSLVADSQMRRTLGEHGRTLVCEKYASSVQATRHLELYRSLIHARAMTVAPRSPPGQSHQLTLQHGSTDPGPAVGSLLEDLKIHCLREEMHGLQRQAELIAKEQVIRSHIVYRRFSVLYWLRMPVHYLRFGIASKIRRLYEQVFPLAKVFHQYPPKPLQIPDHYHKVPVFDRASRPLVSIVTPSFNHGQLPRTHHAKRAATELS